MGLFLTLWGWVLTGAALSTGQMPGRGSHRGLREGRGTGSLEQQQAQKFCCFLIPAWPRSSQAQPLALRRAPFCLQLSAVSIPHGALFDKVAAVSRGGLPPPAPLIWPSCAFQVPLQASWSKRPGGSWYVTDSLEPCTASCGIPSTPG